MGKIFEIMKRKQRDYYIIALIAAIPLFIAGYLFALGEWIYSIIPFAVFIGLNAYVFYDGRKPIN